MLELKKLTVRNFLSYGDYDTSIDLNSLGTCLVLGEIADDDDHDISRVSNGSGKSSIVNAILWGLFGRTMHRANPGDSVINYHTGSNCIVKIQFSNGDEIIRTRKVDNHNDLTYIKDGENVSLGTTKHQQEDLNKELKLDWDLFCGSTFFSQFGRTSWMEMSDQRRKEALEREFHMDRIQYYADIAKSRIDKLEAKQANLQADANKHQSLVDNLNNEIESLSEASANFDDNIRERLIDATNTVNRLIESRDSLQLPDLDELNKQHNTYNKLTNKIDEQNSIVDKLNSKHNKLLASISHRQSLINRWDSIGDFCDKCEQQIPEGHITEKIANPKDGLSELKNKASKLSALILAKKGQLDSARQALINKRPKSISDAKQIHVEWKRRDQNTKSQQAAIDKIKQETNHYADSISKLNNKVDKSKLAIDELRNNISKLDKLINHIRYIYRAYHDRRKIKSHILSEYVPYLNERIAHYLNNFKLNLGIEFTNALAIKSDTWGYEFFSGGERKRVDLSIMLALFDLHLLIYGRRCNIMVFDEVDQHLDLQGAEIFADLIKSNFSTKVDSILVISHRQDMKGVFTSEVKIRKEDNFSRIVEVVQ